MQRGHFNPKKIDDSFSENVFRNYINDIDGQHRFFLQSDINNFTISNPIIKANIIRLGKFQVVKTAAEIPKGEEDHYITSADDFLIRSTMVNKYASLFVEYFCTRLELYIELVLKPILGLQEYYIRYEFQQRGQKKVLFVYL